MKLLIGNSSHLGKNWLYEGLLTTFLGKLALSIMFAALTGLLAQWKVYLPWTPVPVTGQTIAVLLSGVMLGSRWGGISQLFYITLGVSGINWFATGKVNLLSFWGPSFGYLVGFVFAAVFTGYFFENFKNKVSLKKSFLVLSAINFIIIYVPGLVVLGLWNQLVRGAIVSPVNLLTQGFLTFLPIDLLKILVVSGTSVCFKNHCHSGKNVK